jgi:hypothetical protein
MDSQRTLSFLAVGPTLRQPSRTNSTVTLSHDDHTIDLNDLTEENLQRRLSLQVSFFI